MKSITRSFFFGVGGEGDGYGIVINTTNIAGLIEEFFFLKWRFSYNLSKDHEIFDFPVSIFRIESS